MKFVHAMAGPTPKSDTQMKGNGRNGQKNCNTITKILSPELVYQAQFFSLFLDDYLYVPFQIWKPQNRVSSKQLSQRACRCHIIH